MLTVLVQRILRETRNPVVIELGACDGRYTNAIFFCCLSKPKIYSFEADPRNQPICQRNIPTDVTFVPAAVGNVTGPVTFYMASPQPNGEIGSSSLSPFKNQSVAFPWCKCESQTMIDCWRLDDFCQKENLSYVDFIFMDIQGAERLMVEGARETLKATRYLWTEFEGMTTSSEGSCYEHSSSLERLWHLLGPGWEIAEVAGGDALLVNKNCTGNPNPPVDLLYAPVELQRS